MIPSPGRRRDRPGEDGGVWIVTGLVLGALLYVGIVAMAAAGFTGAVPLVVVPPVVAGLIAANSLLGGGRGRRSGPDVRGGEDGAPR